MWYCVPSLSMWGPDGSGPKYCSKSTVYHPLNNKLRFLCYFSGRYVRDICIYGIEDLPWIINKNSMFANKFENDAFPEALDCLEQWHRNKVLSQATVPIETSWLLATQSTSSSSYVNDSASRWDHCWYPKQNSCFKVSSPDSLHSKIAFMCPGKSWLKNEWMIHSLLSFNTSLLTKVDKWLWDVFIRCQCIFSGDK